MESNNQNGSFFEEALGKLAARAQKKIINKLTNNQQISEMEAIVLKYNFFNHASNFLRDNYTETELDGEKTFVKYDSSGKIDKIVPKHRWEVYSRKVSEAYELYGRPKPEPERHQEYSTTSLSPNTILVA